MINRIDRVDYAIFSPPDLEEVKNIYSDYVQLVGFLGRVINLLIGRTNIITIVITDRKMDGEIIQKHSMIVDIFSSMDYKLKLHKIWVKSFKSNMFTLNYSHILTFVKKGCVLPKRAYQMPDVFHIERENLTRISTGTGNAYTFPADLIKIFIEALTDEGETVYDPFMGTGNTWKACRATNRNCIGSEINKEIFEESMKE
jgi:hypothetical protein